MELLSWCNINSDHLCLNPVYSPGDEDYYVYTILTRTRSILIIAMFDDSVARYREIVKLFPQDRLMIWDEETSQHYNEKILSLPAVGIIT